MSDPIQPASATLPAAPDAEIDWDGAVRRHHRRVVVSVMAMGLPIDRAEEIANQAWMRLVQQHREGRLARIELPGLVIKQARYLALNTLRKESDELRRRVLLQPHHTMPHRRADDAEQRILSREKLARCLEVLRGCSDKTRAVFRLVYLDPAPSHADVAQRVGLSVQRVRQILCELRKRLRDTIEEEA